MDKLLSNIQACIHKGCLNYVPPVCPSALYGKKGCHTHKYIIHTRHYDEYYEYNEYYTNRPTSCRRTVCLPDEPYTREYALYNYVRMIV